MVRTIENPVILGKQKGRRIAAENTEEIHLSQWFPESHPGTCQIPYIVHPRSLSLPENYQIRRIWNSGSYQGRDFAPFDIKGIPGKFELAQLIVCGLKASVATYSQHWQGMYIDWTFNQEVKDALEQFGVMGGGERFVKNAFATVVIINTGYRGQFKDLMRFRRRPLPPSMESLEHIDMGTFIQNLNSAVGAVLGGEFGFNVIRESLSKKLVQSSNKKGYDALRELVMLSGMDPDGSIVAVSQLGFKEHRDRVSFRPDIMRLAAAKIIERKSERRNVDFSRRVPETVMNRFNGAFFREIDRSGYGDIIKTMVVEGNTAAGHRKLEEMRELIYRGLDGTGETMIEKYEENFRDGMTSMNQEKYTKMARQVVELGKKVLKPREDAHKMVVVYIDMEKLKDSGRDIDTAEITAGMAIQAGLNSIHLDGTTCVPEDEDMKYGAFCLTGPLHSAELNDSDELINRGWGHGFWDIVGDDLPDTYKMQAILAISAKYEQDAMIAERQAMDERKSVNEIFWYKTWNHPEGKKLDVPQWISYADVLHVVPIPGNDVPLARKELPEHLPEHHWVTGILKSASRQG